jgi:alpha-tubulin suppressor-like RCC1 family protein
MGAYHALALKTNGTVVAWGYNFDGEANVPPGLSNVVAIAAGQTHSLALKSDGRIIGWGTGTFGETNPPAGLNDAVALAAGSAFSVALRSDGTVAAWGASAGGETNVPPGLTNVIAIAAGGGHTLALRADGTITGWGQSSYGETNVPPGLFGMVDIAAGGYTSLGLKGDGSVVITTQPVGQKVFKGDNGHFTVMAAGSPALSYQWKFNGTNIAGATQNIYTRTNVQTTNAGLYSVVVNNSFGAVTSSAAPLTVELPLLLKANGFTSNGGFKIIVTGPPFATFVIETSVGLVIWNDRATNTLSGNGSFNYTDGNAPNFNHRYYRARLQ